MTDQAFRNEVYQRITRCEEKISQLECDDARDRLQKEIDEIKTMINAHDQRIFAIKDEMPNKQTWALITGILIAIVSIVVGALV